MAAGRSATGAATATTMTTTAATKKVAATTEAPIWKSYLAVRTEISGSGSTSWRLQFNGGAMTQARSRKRPKPSSDYAGSGSGSGSGGNADWMATPSHSQSQNRFADESASVAPRIRKYWEMLSAIERQQILFIDEPDLVKQLYKLNLSLLCVGLMQRHLKTPLRSTATVKSATAQSAITAAAGSGSVATPSSTQPKTIEAAATEKATTAETKPPVAAAAAADPKAEKTYELLEAMEFMDIGTGILTVKSELVEDPERLFTLVGDVLFGFVSSIHVLSEKQFYDLFVTESEVINTWEDYQRLIAMLVEQLIIKSYVNYLEKEAASQMEQLLLEISLEDSKITTRKDGNPKDPTSNSSSQNQKSNKKKKKKKKKDASSNNINQGEKVKYQPEPEDFEEEEHESQQLNDENNPDASNLHPASFTVEEVPDDDDEDMGVNEDFTADGAEKAAVAVAFPPEDVLDNPEKASDLPGFSSKRVSSLSSLNPNASVFQPQQEVLQLSGPTTPVSRSPIIGKRKLDKYIVNINIQDAVSEDDEYYPSSDGDLAYSSDDDFRGNSTPQNRQSVTQRWREQEDAELQWQLQQIYSSTSTMLGWDFTRQCELAVQPGVMSPWDDSALWRTAPKEVVRYFSPGGGGNEFGPFFPPFVGSSYPPFAAAGPSPQPKSMYYFAPPPSSSGTPLTTPFIPPGGGVGPRPRMLTPPPAGAAALPQHQRMFAFQEADFRGVVTAPHFPSMKPELRRDRLLRKDHPDPA